MELENGQALIYSHNIERNGVPIAIYKKGPPVRYIKKYTKSPGRPRKQIANPLEPYEWK